jgi:hypothetical protein
MSLFHKLFAVNKEKQMLARAYDVLAGAEEARKNIQLNEGCSRRYFNMKHVYNSIATAWGISETIKDKEARKTLRNEIGKAEVRANKTEREEFAKKCLKD